MNDPDKNGFLHCKPEIKISPWIYLSAMNQSLKLACVNAKGLKARLNGFNICFNMRSTQLLNQMSGTFEQVVQHCWKRKK